MTRSPSRARRGFTLVEVLISMVLIAIMGTVLTKLVVTQSRASSRQVLQRNARAVSRGALAIMESELRAVEQSSAFVGGNALTSAGISVPAPTATAFVVNVPWAVGVRCTAPLSRFAESTYSQWKALPAASPRASPTTSPAVPV